MKAPKGAIQAPVTTRGTPRVAASSSLSPKLVRHGGIGDLRA
jgi:hypothetical protein